MRVVTKIPLDYKLDDEPLFEFKPIKRVRTITDYANNSNYSFVFFKKLKAYNLSNEFSSNKDRKNIVIKNIGNLNQAHLRNALDYVLRNSEEKLAINEDFELKSYKEVLQDWEKDFSDKETSKEAMHLVFSLKEPISKSIIEILKHSVYETMKNNLSEYSFVLIPHTHQNNPHIHCILNKTNTWTGKKLHFAKKSDCRDFFFKLKEDFKNEVYYLSNGKLDYKNDVRLKLDNLLKELQSINEESKQFDYQGFYSQGIRDLNNKHSKIKKNIQNLQSKVMRLYQYRDLSKDNQDNHQNNLQIDNPFKDLNQEQRDKQMRILKNRIAIHNKKLKEIEDEMKKLLDWDSNFSNFTKNFNLFEKKKTLYDSLVKMKSFASKTLFKNLSLLQNSINQDKNYIQHSLDEFNKGFDKSIFLNEKSNMFALNKKYRLLKNYARILKQFVSEDPNFNPNETLNKIKIKEKEILDLMNARINRLMITYKSIQSEVKEQAREISSLSSLGSSLENIDKMLQVVSKHLRNLKALNFIGKEFLLAKKVFRDNKELKDITYDTQKNISKQIKQANQITQKFNRIDEKTSEKPR